MGNKIYTKEDKLIIEIPLKSKRSNPWDDDYDAEMSHVLGLIINHRGNSEYDQFGFAYWIDMEYKDKGDQWTDFFYEHMEGTAEDFKELCRELKIAIVEYTETHEN